MQLFFTKPPFQGFLMSDFDLLPLLLSTLDDKTMALLRFYEHQIAFLLERVHGRLLPDESEKAALARLAFEVGKPDLKNRALLFHPETFFRWHKELIAKKFDGSKQRGPGRPSTWHILRMAVETMRPRVPLGALGAKCSII
jgi:hypothetical protein